MSNLSGRFWLLLQITVTWTVRSDGGGLTLLTSQDLLSGWVVCSVTLVSDHYDMDCGEQKVQPDSTSSGRRWEMLHFCFWNATFLPVLRNDDGKQQNRSWFKITLRRWLRFQHRNLSSSIMPTSNRERFQSVSISMDPTTNQIPSKLKRRW